jgi:2',3'-cyclic-nucleotide 2'-phosphodiesterase / 3'-nucleotidase / 5'-nucleotidase
MKRIASLTLSVAAMPALAAGPAVDLQVLGTYTTGIFDEGAAEIVAYDASTVQAFVVNANDQSVDVLDLRNPGSPTLAATVDISAISTGLGAANSIAVSNGLLAVAVEADPKQANGIVAVYDTATLTLQRTFPAGALPDALTFSPDGKKILVANEGEPSDDYSNDPEGSITVIDITKGLAKAKVSQVTFGGFNSRKQELLNKGVRIYGPNATVAQDLEPEFIAVRPNGVEALVTLQENNAFAKLDLVTNKVTDIIPLGYKDHLLTANKLDPSDREGGIRIANWPVFGIYSPDAIAAYQVGNDTYYVTANEGDTRDYDAFGEESRVRDLDDAGLALDPNVFTNSAITGNSQLGRLTITTTLGDANGDNLLEQIYVPGGRSFSIWDTRGRKVYDSGSMLEDVTAALLPANFNASNSTNSLDNRSDNKGPEPEGVAIGAIDGRAYAFIGLERIGGIMTFEVTDPTAPEFKDYINNRNFSADPCTERDSDGDCRTGAGYTNLAALDNGPEGLAFVPAASSPNGKPLLIVGNETSGSTTIYQINVTP